MSEEVVAIDLLMDDGKLIVIHVPKEGMLTYTSPEPGYSVNYKPPGPNEAFISIMRDAEVWESGNRMQKYTRIGVLDTSHDPNGNAGLIKDIVEDRDGFYSYITGTLYQDYLKATGSAAKV